MSAYIVDPRTVDYIVAWAERQKREQNRVHLDDAARDSVPAELQDGIVARSDWAGNPFHQWDLAEATPTQTGQLLMLANVRSVQYRYPDTAADDLPGPCDQALVWSYKYRPVPATKLRAEWVVKSCDCLRYQSCEIPGYEQTAARKVLDAIRESAIYHLTEAAKAPWGVTDEDLSGKAVA